MTQHVFTTSTKEIPYTLKRRRYQRRVNLIMHQDGTLTVTAPKTCPLYYVKRVLQKNESWIMKHAASKESQRFVTVDPVVVAHMKEVMRVLVHKKLTQFNVHYGFTYDRVAIRMQKSRWGSCSEKGNLNFNCKIAFLPEHLQDYIIVHELCHLKELNHSARFWALVAECVPDHKERRKELRKMVI